MKIIIKKSTSTELKRLNNKYGDEMSSDFDNWSEMSEEETLITDACMYADGAYIKNKFDNLKTWCRELGPNEYQQTYLNTHPDVVYNKVQMMLKNNLIEIK